MIALMVKRLVMKDWYFQRLPIAGSVVIGAVALVLVGMGRQGAFFIGTILLLTVLIALGAQLVIATVINEHTEHTLPFVMSLPISQRDYTSAKILANMLIFLVAWLALGAGTVAVIIGRASVPDGLLPFTAVMLVEILVSHTLLLAVALVTESQGWAIGTMVTTNFLLNGFLYWVAHMPAVATTMGTEQIVWSTPILLLLAAEVSVICFLLAFTFWAQARKTEFL